jgi:O-methyltransferase
MRAELRRRYTNWKAHPRRWELAYILSRIPAVIRHGVAYEPPAMSYAPLDPPVDVEYVEQLHDEAFSKSVAEVKEFSCMDVVRLANLWNMVRLAGEGTFLEVGSYRGGTALHLCNAIDRWHPGARFFSFDPFETGGFESMTEYDTAFKANDFTGTEYGAVCRLLAPKPNATVVRGFFPHAAADHDLGQIAFCHLDVDMYEATLNSLEFVVDRLAARGVIVVDDFWHKETPGVEKATLEFVAKHPEFVCVPMFPCQAVLLPKTLWPS